MYDDLTQANKEVKRLLDVLQRLYIVLLRTDNPTAATEQPSPIEQAKSLLRAELSGTRRRGSRSPATNAPQGR